MAKTQVAIACQGGGTHTAFTAGVLKHFLESEIDKKYKLVGLSGTSGGAVCATAALYGILKARHGGEASAFQPLVDFWYENTPQSLQELLFSKGVDICMKVAESGLVPQYPPNPYRDAPALAATMQLFDRREFLDFRALLNKHIDFEELNELIDKDSPRLLLGAVNILTGRFKTFDSLVPGDIRVEAILASAAVPNVFEAVHIEGDDGAYWDGLFSQNPPVAQFLNVPTAERPDEIWVIQINPWSIEEEPKTAAAIGDRRNELSGNLSLYQELRFIQLVNQWIEKGAFRPDIQKQLKPIKIRIMTLRKELSSQLGYTSKLSRDGSLVKTLIEEGEQQAKAFLAKLAEPETLATLEARTG